jgi:DNA polymerase II small subunit
LSAVQKAIAEALRFGYQIDPEALKLIQRLGERRRIKGEPSEPTLDMIVRLVIDEKSKSQSGLTIHYGDLKLLFPDFFDFVEESGFVGGGAGKQETKDGSSITPEVEIVQDPSSSVQATGTEGFSQLFKSRYEKLVKILMERPEGRQLTKISEAGGGKGNVRVAGLVFSKRPMKNGGIEFTLDDDTGSASILALGEEVKRAVSEVALDQCVMVDADLAQGKMMAKRIVQPDVPSKLGSTSKKTVYAVFLSDLHIGSNKFMDSAFKRFLEWLSGRGGGAEEDEEIVRRLKYIVIGGDVVDGVGVFPNQEYELEERDVYKQYAMVWEKLKLIPEHLQMFVIPGNHDATRQALPQPMIPRKYAEGLYSLPNVRMLGDPCLFKLHGVSILTYHGRSLDDVLATTPGLSYERPQEAMKVLLRARHLAPIFGLRTPISPEVEDHLVISEVPDIFHAGHVHTVGQESYKSTLILNSGTWQAQTGYQANLGISPRPGVVPIVNLATIEVSWKEFLTSESVGARGAG